MAVSTVILFFREIEIHNLIAIASRQNIFDLCQFML